MIRQRIDLYKELEARRSSKLLVYVTSDRPNAGTQIASDILSPFTEHLDKLGDVNKISLYIYTRGGNTLSAWTLVNLIRNFCKEFEVIIPFNCHSAGTLISLGANNIVMTKQATLGPIDPSVNGPLNPQIPGTNNPNAKVPVSVEFVDAYIKMVKSEIGINDQHGLSNILVNLSDKIHPLTLGHVYRSKAQIEMLANKLLKYHKMDEINRTAIIKFLCSDSGSHDYTMDRKEAKSLGLNIEKPDMELYKCIKAIYDDIEQELELRSPYDPNVVLGDADSKNYSLRRALIESVDYGCDVFVTEGTLTKHTVMTAPNIPQTSIRDSRTFDGWRKEELN